MTTKILALIDLILIMAIDASLIVIRAQMVSICAHTAKIARQLLTRFAANTGCTKDNIL